MNRPIPFSTEFEDAPFWEFCRKQELRLQYCVDCRRFWWPIGPVCHRCLGGNYEWRPVTGTGTVCNYVVYHKAYYPEFRDCLPYLVAEIELPEGVRLVGNIEGLRVDAPRQAILGARATVYFEESGAGIRIPQWRVAQG